MIPRQKKSFASTIFLDVLYDIHEDNGILRYNTLIRMSLDCCMYLFFISQGIKFFVATNHQNKRQRYLRWHW